MRWVVGDGFNEIRTRRFRNAAEASCEPGDNRFWVTINGFRVCIPCLAKSPAGFGLTPGRQKTSPLADFHGRRVHRWDDACSRLSTRRSRATLSAPG